MCHTLTIYYNEHDAILLKIHEQRNRFDISCPFTLD
ncbi:hypothetical protein FH603_937 [Spirosoma sp. LMG 31447]|uniref:Uncharacterized protein n=1 Tax=Spirosoma utsteinense TaxID=2585773 RepID=A0ABR6W1I8_9BACT|nr:hypothetical protein [Spirosoma utsteinense]